MLQESSIKHPNYRMNLKFKTKACLFFMHKTFKHGAWCTSTQDNDYLHTQKHILGVFDYNWITGWFWCEFFTKFIATRREPETYSSIPQMHDSLPVILKPAECKGLDTWCWRKCNPQLPCFLTQSSGATQTLSSHGGYDFL